MPSPIITVHNSYELAVAINELSKGSGGTIEVVNGGEPYALSRYQVGPEVGEINVVAANPADPPVFEQIKLVQSQNITFSGLTFDSTNSTLPGKDLEILDSNSITFENNVFANSANGFYDGTNPDISKGSSFALVRDSEDFSFFDNDVSGYYQGLAVIDSVGTQIIGNSFTKMTGDGVRLSGVQDTLVEGNTFSDFYGTSQDLNHSDMIQVWSASYNTLNTEDLVIRGNFLNSNGGAATQSIFIKNETYGSTGDAFLNITIEDNTIYNGHLHGVAIYDTIGVVVENNTLLWDKEAAMRSTPNSAGQSTAPEIRLYDVVDGTVSGNITANVLKGNNEAFSNAIVTYENPAKDSYYNNNFVNASDGGDLDIRDISLRSTSVWVDTYGSSAVQPDARVGPLTAVISQSYKAGSVSTYVYDGTYSFGPAGVLPEDETLYIWTFSDGTVLEGPQVTHTFAEAGAEDVTLTITTPSGSTSVTRVTSVVPDALISLDFDEGVQDSSTYATTVAEVGARDSVAGVEGEGFQLTGSNKLQIERENAHLQKMTTFTMDLSLKLDEGGDVGTFVHMHKTLRAEVTEEGEIIFTLTTTDGSFQAVTPAGTLNDTDWHDVTVTFSESYGGLKIYVDNLLAAQVDATGIVAPDGTLYDLVLGDSWNPSLQGTIDDFSITRSIPENLQDDDLDAPLIGPPVDMLLELDFEDGAFDISGQDTAVRVKTPGDDALVVGVSGQGFYLDGNNKVIVDRNEEQFHELESFSVAMSLATPEGGESGTFIHIHKALNAQILEDGSLKLNVTTTDGRFEVVTEPGLLSDEEWQRVVIVFDGSEDGRGLEIHMNGVMVARSEASGALDYSGTYHLVFGNTWKDSAELAIDDVIITDPAMGVGDIALDYIETAQQLIASGNTLRLSAEPLTVVEDEPGSDGGFLDNVDPMMLLMARMLMNNRQQQDDPDPSPLAVSEPLEDLWPGLPVDDLIFAS